MKADLIIKNGLVIDPYRQIKSSETIAVSGNKIIEATEYMEANQIIDAAGCIVSPGLIDFHGHYADTISDLGVNPEMICYPTGVTTIVDAGTTGVANYLGFRNRSMQSQLQTFGLLHINPAGITTSAYHESMEPRYCNDNKIKAYMGQYNDQLIGLKVRQSAELVGELGLKPLNHLRRLADDIGCFLVVHVTNPPCEIEEILELLKPGDVFCHAFHGKGNTIIGKDGKVIPAVKEAQKKGVIFDAANGANHFAFRTAIAALSDGFLPDIISTDIDANNAYVKAKAFSLPYIMSKYLALDVSLDNIFRFVILNPAKHLGYEKELGSMIPGTIANIAIHRLVEKEMVFEDSLGETYAGNQVFRTEMTINKGRIVFRTIEI